jgi:hypothetical protein
MSAISHTEYVNVPPPAYSEAPADDLAAQLEQMKAMMEQMRQDKERLEMEAKRYEMEVKRKEEEEAAATLRAKQEAEAAAKLQKEKKELDAVFKIFTDSSCIRNGKWSDEVWEFAGKKEIQFLRALEAAGETLLLVHLDQSRYGKWDGGAKQNLWSVSIILTNCHLYRLQYKPIHSGIPASDEFFSSKIYSFANPLNLAHATLLSSIMKVPKEDEYCLCSLSIWQRVSYVLRDTGSYNKPYQQGLKNFETIIRLIPGSYKNGSWRQVDGFFGVYFNETTMEVSEVPPPSL